MKKIYIKLLLLLCCFGIANQLNATSHTVQVSNYQFSPANVNAFVGDTMHFVWVSGGHTTTCDGSNGSTFPAGAPTWNSPINSSVSTFDYTITVAGSYHYVCIPHAPGMAGNITATLPPNPFVNITFSVDLSQTTICPNGPHLVGSFNGWNSTATPMTLDTGNVYVATVSLDSTTTVQYKFLKDNDYPCGDETVPAGCAVGGNRELVVPDGDALLPIVCFGSCSACAIPVPHDSVYVTLSVDLSQQTICPGGPHIAGSFNGWSTTATPLDSMGNGIYQVILYLDTQETHEYKFLKDSDWTCGGESVPGACSVNGNRQIIVPETDTILPVVCFGSCSACSVPVPHDSVYVTLSVDLSQQTICAGGPHIAGTFNGWSTTATPLDSMGAGIYQVILYLDTQETHEYKFLKDSDWVCGGESVPGACSVNGNRQIIVPEADTILPLVCFNSCGVCVPPPPTVNVTFRCDFSQTTACAAGPHIVGAFNGWNSTANPMTLVSGSIYEATFALNIGDTAQYKFLNDDQYSACGNENVPQACGVDNGFGGYNRFIAPQNDTILPAVCFSSCAVCTPANEKNVTFRVDMSQTTLGPGGPHIAGTFNAFNAAATPMNAVGGGIYSYTLPLDTTLTIQYTFLKDSTYNGQEIITSACGVSNGFGGFNRFIDVPEYDTILPPFCYSSCTVCPTGINNYNGSDFISVYPNPTENNIYVETVAVHDNFRLKLFSMDGKLLFIKQVDAGSQQTIAIDMSGFTKGVYTLKLETSDDSSFRKIILK